MVACVGRHKLNACMMQQWPLIHLSQSVPSMLQLPGTMARYRCTMSTTCSASCTSAELQRLCQICCDMISSARACSCNSGPFSLSAMQKSGSHDTGAWPIYLTDLWPAAAVRPLTAASPGASSTNGMGRRPTSAVSPPRAARPQVKADFELHEPCGFTAWHAEQDSSSAQHMLAMNCASMLPFTPAIPW